MIGVIIFVVVICMAIIISYAIIQYRMSSNNEEEFMDDTLVEVYMPQYLNSCSEGVLVKVIKGVERDIYFIRPYLRRTKKDNKLEIKPIPICAPLHNVQFLPRGSLSGERNKIKIFPPNVEDFPKEFRESIYGKSIIEAMTKFKAERTCLDIQRSEIEMSNEMLKLDKGKDLFRQYYKKDKELRSTWMKNSLELVKNNKGNLSSDYNKTNGEY